MRFTLKALNAHGSQVGKPVGVNAPEKLVELMVAQKEADRTKAITHWEVYEGGVLVKKLRRGHKGDLLDENVSRPSKWLRPAPPKPKNPAVQGWALWALAGLALLVVIGVLVVLAWPTPTP